MQVTRSLSLGECVGVYYTRITYELAGENSLDARLLHTNIGVLFFLYIHIRSVLLLLSLHISYSLNCWYRP